VRVRAVNYRLENKDDNNDKTIGNDEKYLLVTTLLDCEKYPAEELAWLYPVRWEIETAYDEFKTHLRGGRVVLRSKTPELVRQEFYGFLMAHFCARQLMHEAALVNDIEPLSLSFTHTVEVIKRKLPTSTKVGFSPSAASAAS
jgi:IS4 transposase